VGKRKALMKASELREKRKKRREQLEVLLLNICVTSRYVCSRSWSVLGSLLFIKSNWLLITDYFPQK